MSGILAVGPRKLPEQGEVRVWLDTGSAYGREITVPVAHLAVADVDDGRGDCAVYVLGVLECEG